MTRRVAFLLAALLTLGILLTLAASSGLPLLLVAVVLIVAADQLQTVVNYRATSERMSLMFTAVMVVALYLPPLQALVAAFIGTAGANLIHRLIEGTGTWHQALVRTITMWFGALALIGVYEGFHQWLAGEWPSLASAVSLAAGGVAHEVAAVGFLGALALLRGTDTPRSLLRQWWSTAFYPTLSILVACSFGLVIENHPLALVAVAALALVGLKPSYTLRSPA